MLKRMVRAVSLRRSFRLVFTYECSSAAAKACSNPMRYLRRIQHKKMRTEWLQLLLARKTTRGMSPQMPLLPIHDQVLGERRMRKKRKWEPGIEMRSTSAAETVRNCLLIQKVPTAKKLPRAGPPLPSLATEHGVLEMPLSGLPR